MAKTVEYLPVDGCEECEFFETACPECILYEEAKIKNDWFLNDVSWEEYYNAEDHTLS